MIRTTRRKILVTSAVMTATALSLSVMPAQAISPRSETGVTSTSIKLGITLPMTGSASFGYNQLPGAMKAYFDYVNANGGVNGRKINLVVKNDAYLPKQAIQNTQDLIGKDKVLAVIGALGTANNKAVASAVNLGRRGVPSLFINTGFSGFTDRKKYSTSSMILPSYIMEAKMIGKYVNETYPGKKICLLYQDDDFGDDALVGFDKAYGNLDFAVKVAYPSLSQGVTGVPDSWISKFVGKCDVQVVFGVASATLYTILAAVKGSYAPKWILGSVGADIGSINPATVPYIIGATSMSFLPSVVDPKDEYVTQFKEIHAAYNSKAKFNSWALIGMNTAFVAVQALQAAGKNLTRKSLLAAIDNSGSKFASAGLVPLNYSKTSNVGYNGYWFGTFNRTGDLVPNDTFTYTPYTTDSGTGAVVKSTYARPKMPAKGLPN